MSEPTPMQHYQHVDRMLRQINRHMQRAIALLQDGYWQQALDELLKIKVIEEQRDVD